MSMGENVTKEGVERVALCLEECEINSMKIKKGRMMDFVTLSVMINS